MYLNAKKYLYSITSFFLYGLLLGLILQLIIFLFNYKFQYNLKDIEDLKRLFKTIKESQLFDKELISILAFCSLSIVYVVIKNFRKIISFIEIGLLEKNIFLYLGFSISTSLIIDKNINIVFIFLLIILFQLGLSRLSHSLHFNNHHGIKQRNSSADSPLEFIHQLDEIKINKNLFEDLKTQILYLANLIKSFKKLTVINHSYVICINGKWGSGKTSMINMTKHHIIDAQQPLEDVNKELLKYNLIWIDFNPWSFGNTTELFTEFFHTLDSEISKVYGYGLGKNLTKYVQLVTPAFEQTQNLFIKLILCLPFFQSPTIQTIKNDLKNRLKNINETIVIVLDDIDRLEPKDILELTKLVKSVSDFPNIIFILPMHYVHVSTIITNELKAPYSNYLEKIVNKKILLHNLTYKEFNAIFNYHCNNLLLKDVIFEQFILEKKSEQVRDERDIYNSIRQHKDNEITVLNEFEYKYFEPLFSKLLKSSLNFRYLYKQYHEPLYIKLHEIIRDLLEKKFTNITAIQEEIKKINIYMHSIALLDTNLREVLGIFKLQLELILRKFNLEDTKEFIYQILMEDRDNMKINDNDMKAQNLDAVYIYLFQDYKKNNAKKIIDDIFINKFKVLYSQIDNLINHHNILINLDDTNKALLKIQVKQLIETIQQERIEQFFLEIHAEKFDTKQNQIILDFIIDDLFTPRELIQNLVEKSQNI